MAFCYDMPITNDMENVANTILNKSLEKKPILIAIEGHGGSGKSTFAAKLCGFLASAYVVHLDDFIVKEKQDDQDLDKGWFDRKRLEEQVLKPATEGSVVNYQKRTKQIGVLSHPISVPDVDYLIVEGISSYHPDIAGYYQWKIWVDTPIEIARARGKARGGDKERLGRWDIWSEGDLLYQAKYHPEQRADFVVKGF